MRSINTFFNQVRRRVSVLEGPLVSGRGEKICPIYDYNTANILELL